jgi:hypothetical protein
MYIYSALLGRPEGNRLLGGPRHRWEDNIKTHLEEIDWDRVHWLDLARERDKWRAVVNVAGNLEVQ